MRLQVEDGDMRRAVAVSIDDQEASVRDLADVLGFGKVPGLRFDGVFHRCDVLLRYVALVNGAAISSGEEVSSSPPDSGSTPFAYGRTWVGLVGGPDTGALIRVDRDRSITIGRGDANDLSVENETVSSKHAVIELVDGQVVVEDLGSHNGTWISSRAISARQQISEEVLLRIGSSIVRVHEVERGDRPVGTSPQHADENGRILFNRPPRTPVLDGLGAVDLPESIAVRSNPALAIVSLVVPLVLAGAMVALLGSWRYALFGLLSPVMTYGNWLASRRKVRHQRAVDQTTQREEMVRLVQDLDRHEHRERARRSAFGPDLLEVRRRIELPSSRLWERRHGHADAMTVRLGFGSAAWSPPVNTPLDDAPADVDALLATRSVLSDTELLVDLRRGPLGIVGDDRRAKAAARAVLLQLAASHGPADLRIAILTTREGLDAWGWASWLPHCMTSSAASGGPMVLAGDASSALATALLEDISSAGSEGGQLQPGWLLVVDDVSLLHGRSSSARLALAHVSSRVFGVVLTRTADQLPASVVTMVSAEADDGEFLLAEPSSPGRTSTGILDSVSITVARDLARSLARFEDPEVELITGHLPEFVRSEEILGEGVNADEIRRRWSRSKHTPGLEAPIGRSENGLVSVDLVADGPHALVAGTTGAGKSEFLRTLIVGLTSNHDPDDLVFVLIDYKGGSAFDTCAELPHVVGVVTDLDEHLAGRALQSLEAELHLREKLLRDAEARDITDYRNLGSPGGALPRLVVVIDEFATLRAELPEFVAALVGIAQRGRSLGVHLVLATQRPSGAIDANIRANTNLRVCLRVQDASDSTDVIDSARGAQISRTAPGRAFVRRGDGDLLAVQTAYVSGSSRKSGQRIRATEIVLGGGEPIRFQETAVVDEQTDLDRLLDVMIDAARDHEAPRRPWLEDLPTTFSAADVEEMALLPAGDTSTIRFAIGDDPGKQRRVTLGWDPDDGHLGVFGVLGSGVSTTLRSVVALLGTSVSGRDVWVFGCDHAAGGLRALEDYPHVACCLEASEAERHERLLTFLSGELERRRGLSHATVLALPLIVLAVDGVGAFCESNDVAPGTVNGDLLTRLGRDGPGVGIVLVLGSRGLDDVPRSLRTSIRRHVVLEQASANDYANFGIRTRDLPAFAPGRALIGAQPRDAQIVDFHALLEHDAFRIGTAPPVIEALPSTVKRSDLGTASVEPHLSVPIGIAGMTRDQADLVLRPGEHALVAGPPGSGRTSALRLIAEQVRDVASEVVIVGVAPHSDGDLFTRSVFDAAGCHADVQHVLRMSVDDPRRWLILVDDADRIDVESGPLLDLAKKAPPHVTIVAAMRSSVAHQTYGHWTRSLRTSGNGILLQPDNAHDGELFGLRLPRGTLLREVPGRGYLVSGGSVSVVQLAR
jgi:S-DNA-T family DNA segregation ATPase FtsK/SpoIIIE